MSPRVAVVTAAFDAKRFVGDAVRSVLAQTVDDWELVVVDDGSTDDTAAAAEEAASGDARVRVVRTEHSGLPAVARNVALRSTTAPLVAVLDADDVWRPDKLARQLAILEERSAVGLVHSAAERIVNGQTLPPAPGDHSDLPPLRRLVLQNCVVNSSVVFRRALTPTDRAFDEDPRLRGTEDYELWLRLAAVSELAFVDEPLLAYRVHGEQLSSDDRSMTAATIAALQKAEPLFPQLRGDFARSIGILRCVLGAKGRGRRELLVALRSDPSDALAWSWLARAVVGATAVERVGRALRGGQRRATASS